MARRRLLETLTKKDVALAGSRLINELGRPFREAAEFAWRNGKISGSIRLASGRFAIVENGKTFTLVAWRKARRMRKSTGIGIDAKKGVSC